MNKIIKRDGREVFFDKSKIVKAVLAAFKDVDGKITAYAVEKADNIGNYIEQLSKEKNLTIEEIQDYVEKGLMSCKRKDVAKSYILYRKNRDYARENTIDKTIEEIVSNTSSYWVDENSNKDSQLATTVRDYIAGEVSTDTAKRRLLSQDIVKAHEEGILHFHDMDYFIQPIYNCCLINLEDMLQNGTVISKTLIEKPHKFSTACNIGTQIIAQVASSQYGGQSISLAHLSPFVQSSRDKFNKKFPNLPKEVIEEMVKEDVRAGVQTLQYQIITLMTTNGQAPFITVYMNLNEAKTEQEKKDLALVIEEVLKQRIKGVKNEKGIDITPAFPKLIYALDEDNIKAGSPYYYLTELAAKCTAKRMVPDYISNKIERQLKSNDEYPCMGCRSFLTVDRTAENYANALNWNPGHKYYGRLTVA